jgi:hypothetical protein
LNFENGKAATPKYTPPIEVLINARGVLEGYKNKQETYKDLLCTLAPLSKLELVKNKPHAEKTKDPRFNVSP